MKKTHILSLTIVILLFLAGAVLISADEIQITDNQITKNSVSLVEANSESAKQQGNAVCPDPAKPCHHKQKKFDVWEMSFKLPARIVDNKSYKSAPFYAVMLKTINIDDDCDGGEYYKALESERKKVQATQPQRKVFASYACPNMGAVDYDFAGKIDASGDNVLIQNFIAVYGGTTQTEAETLRRTLSAKYPKAVVKKMNATWERIVQ